MIDFDLDYLHCEGCCSDHELHSHDIANLNEMCWTCRDALVDAARTLFANIATVGALQAAYIAGGQFGFQWARREPIWPTAWDPGEGKPYFLLTPERLDLSNTWSSASESPGTNRPAPGREGK